MNREQLAHILRAASMIVDDPQILIIPASPANVTGAQRRPNKHNGRVTFDRITIEPDKMGGLPCLRGLRVPVTTVVGQLAAGRTYDEVLSDFPDLELADIYAALRFAAVAVR